MSAPHVPSGHVLSCPLCGLRYAARPSLELHVRDDHDCVPAEAERRETLHVAATPWQREGRREAARQTPRGV